jgi:hypothetical protein
MHAIGQARRLHQALYVRYLGRDGGSRCADGDQTEVRRAFWRRLDALVGHFGMFDLWQEDKGEMRIVEIVKRGEKSCG